MFDANLQPTPRWGRLFRPIDVAVWNTVATVEAESKKVPVIFSTPDRAVARLQKILGIVNVDNIPLPYIAINRQNISFDQTRFRRAPIYWKNPPGLGFTSDGNAIKGGRQPLPYLFDYRIMFWDRYRWRLNEMLEDYLLRFTPRMLTYVDYGPVWGVFECHTALAGIDELSELEPGEDQNRKLRVDVSITVEGWLMPYHDQKPTVRQISIEYPLGEEEDITPPQIIDENGEVITFCDPDRCCPPAG